MEVVRIPVIYFTFLHSFSLSSPLPVRNPSRYLQCLRLYTFALPLEQQYMLLYAHCAPLGFACIDPMVQLRCKGENVKTSLSQVSFRALPFLYIPTMS